MSTEMEHLLTLARDLTVAERAIEEAELKLKEAKQRRDNIAEIMLPEAMETLGMTEFKLQDGSKIMVKPDLFCGITKEREDDAFAWMRDHGAGSLIKRQLLLSFGRGEDAKADAAREDLRKKFKREIGDKTSVHHSTLKAWIKESLAAGVALPFDLFGIVPKKTAVLTPAAQPTT